VRTFSERVADVRRVVAAAQEVVGARAAFAPEIARTSGLSVEGVMLGLTRHLETDPTDDDVRALVERAGNAEWVHVVLAANVFVAPLRAIAIAFAASERVAVKPSRRAPTFAQALVGALADPRVTVESDVDLERVANGEVHVYGRDATIAAIRSRVGAGVRVRGHGAGMGVAVVTSRADVDEAARAIADDIVPFDQRGCLSPRVAFVEGGGERARAFCAALSAELERFATTVPRGVIDDEERAEAVRYGETIAFSGEVWRGAGHLVGLASSVAIPPAGRHLHVVPIVSMTELQEKLAPFARYVVAIGSDDPARAASGALPQARPSLLGAMQRPPLDGPVDLRGDAG
jgi:Acyl-CoA reductase (LuxC)